MNPKSAEGEEEKPRAVIQVASRGSHASQREMKKKKVCDVDRGSIVVNHLNTMRGMSSWRFAPTSSGYPNRPNQNMREGVLMFAAAIPIILPCYRSQVRRLIFGSTASQGRFIHLPVWPASVPP